VRDESLSRTVRPSNCPTGRLENSATLFTGPSLVIPISGRSRSRSAWRAYSTALITLTSSSPATSSSFSSAGVPVTSSAGTVTAPRSMAR